MPLKYRSPSIGVAGTLFIPLNYEDCYDKDARSNRYDLAAGDGREPSSPGRAGGPAGEQTLRQNFDEGHQGVLRMSESKPVTWPESDPNDPGRHEIGVPARTVDTASPRDERTASDNTVGDGRVTSSESLRQADWTRIDALRAQLRGRKV